MRYLASIEPEYERNDDIDRNGNVMEMPKWPREKETAIPASLSFMESVL